MILACDGMCAVQIERLRKEGSRLVAEEQEKLQQQLREEASQLYNDADTGVRLRVGSSSTVCWLT